MENILLLLFGNHSSPGGPQLESGGIIGMIAQCCTSSLKSAHYMIFPGLAVNCEIPAYTASLHWDPLTTEVKKSNGTGLCF